MLTLEELKDKVERECKGFKLGTIDLDGEYVCAFILNRQIDDEVLTYCYFWNNNLVSYISYFI